MTCLLNILQFQMQIQMRQNRADFKPWLSYLFTLLKGQAKIVSGTFFFYVIDYKR